MSDWNNIIKEKHHKIDLLLIISINACFVYGWQVSFKDIRHDSSKILFSILLCITIIFDLKILYQIDFHYS